MRMLLCNCLMLDLISHGNNLLSLSLSLCLYLVFSLCPLRFICFFFSDWRTAHRALDRTCTYIGLPNGKAALIGLSLRFDRIVGGELPLESLIVMLLQ